MKKNVAPENLSYKEIDALANEIAIGSEGISILPFGNGAERVLGNKEIGCSIHGINFNKHGKAQLLRAAQEGIVFSFAYGMEIMQAMGIDTRVIRAGFANMFMSSIFRDTLAGVTGATIELFNTDGSVGAAKGAGIGAGIYKSNVEAFETLEKLKIVEPDKAHEAAYKEAYELWKSKL